MGDFGIYECSIAPMKGSDGIGDEHVPEKQIAVVPYVAVRGCCGWLCRLVRYGWLFALRIAVGT